MSRGTLWELTAECKSLAKNLRKANDLVRGLVWHLNEVHGVTATLVVLPRSPEQLYSDICLNNAPPEPGADSDERKLVPAKKNQLCTGVRKGR